MQCTYFKVVVFDDTDIFEFKLKENRNVGTIDDVHKFMLENITKYPNSKWLLLPIM